MNSIISMNHSRKTLDVPSMKLTRREELEQEKAAVQSVLMNAERFPGIFSTEFIDEKKELLEEILAELALYEDQEVNK